MWRGVGEYMFGFRLWTTTSKGTILLRVRLIARFDFSDQSPHSRAFRFLDSFLFGRTTKVCVFVFVLCPQYCNIVFVYKCVLSDAFVFWRLT